MQLSGMTRPRVCDTLVVRWPLGSAFHWAVFEQQVVEWDSRRESVCVSLCQTAPCALHWLCGLCRSPRDPGAENQQQRNRFGRCEPFGVATGNNVGQKFPETPERCAVITKGQLQWHPVPSHSLIGCLVSRPGFTAIDWEGQQASSQPVGFALILSVPRLHFH